MKMTIRRGVFETNSSSVHVLTLTNEDKYEKFKNGELFFDRCSYELVTKEEYLKDYKMLSPAEKQEILEATGEELCELTDGELYDVDTYYNELVYYYETFYDTYKTKNGEEIIAFGYYGYDG